MLIIQVIDDQFGDIVLHLNIVKSQIYNAVFNSPKKLSLDNFMWLSDILFQSDTCQYVLFR